MMTVLWAKYGLQRRIYARSQLLNEIIIWLVRYTVWYSNKKVRKVTHLANSSGDGKGCIIFQKDNARSH